MPSPRELAELERMVQDVVAAALDNVRAKPALGFADCLVLEISQKAVRLPLGTFDKALSKLDGTRRL